MWQVFQSPTAADQPHSMLSQLSARTRMSPMREEVQSGVQTQETFAGGESLTKYSTLDK